MSNVSSCLKIIQWESDRALRRLNGPSVAIGWCLLWFPWSVWFSTFTSFKITCNNITADFSLREAVTSSCPTINQPFTEIKLLRFWVKICNSTSEGLGPSFTLRLNMRHCFHCGLPKSNKQVPLYRHLLRTHVKQPDLRSRGAGGQLGVGYGKQLTTL